MRPIARQVSAAGMVLALGLETVQAAPAFTTKYSYYSVSGGNPTAIYASLLKNLQHMPIGRVHAYTSTTFYAPKTVRTAKGCQVGKLPVNFLIRLPRHSNEASLSSRDRRLWQQFADSIRKHEETHRAFWMGCARNMDAIISGLRGPSCEDISRRVRSIVEQGRLACRRKDIAFDAAERRRFDTHPFMRAALAPIYAPVRDKRKTKPVSN